MYFFLILALAQSECITQKYYTDCLLMQRRDVIITGSSDCDSSFPKFYKGLDCTFSCSAGSYLDLVNGKEVCSLCPAGTFSIGGGLMYGNPGLSWDSALQDVINECWVKDLYLDLKNYNCTPWDVKDQVLVSGKATSNTTYTSVLRLASNLLKPGTFKLTYRKESFKVNGVRVGSFTVLINLKKVYSDDTIEQALWKTVELPLSSGSQQIIIEYRTARSERVQSAHAYISAIQITGTSYADTFCYPCANGASEPGSTSCDSCDFNQYWDGGECANCTASTFAYKGSVGADSCLPRLPCDFSDFKHVFSPCVNSSREQSYQWKQPIFCDYESYSLPSTVAQVDCEECQSGFFPRVVGGARVCVACVEGQSLDIAHNLCRPCSEGTYAWRTYNFTDWTDLPQGFSTHCLASTGGMCMDSAGWVPSTYYIGSGTQITAHSEVFLVRNFNVEANIGILKFNYQFLHYAGGDLEVYVNGLLWGNLSSTTNDTVSIELGTGTNSLQWVYWPHDTTFEEVRIYNIKIHGSDEGGSTACLKCPAGTISATGQTKCDNCNPGQTSNINNTKCVQWPSDYYSVKPGKCMKCPSGTIHNHNHTACVGTEYAYFNGKTLFLSNITGRGAVEGQYFKGICEMPSSKLYCYQTFYGPLASSNKEFYVSVLNPAEIALPGASFLYNQSSSYAFAVAKRSTLSKVREDPTTGCNDQEVVVSLGRTVSAVNIVDGMLKIDYSNGDVCDSKGNTYNMSLCIACDMSAGIGWPSYSNEDGCSFNFMWKSKYGCPICMFDEMPVVVSECYDGKRKYTKEEGRNCIVPYLGELSWTEDCKEMEDYIYSWPMMVGFSLITGLIILGLVSVGCYCKYHRGYRRLADASS